MFEVIGRRSVQRGLLGAGILLAVSIIGCWINWSLAGDLLASATERKLPIYSVEREDQVVALAFNCAWDDQDVQPLLELLEQEGIRATFFVVGEWCDRYPETVKAIAQAGHEIGSHSDTHPDMAKLNRTEIVGELERSAEKIERLTGTKPELFRPPSGSYSDTVIEVSRELGFYPIQWDADSIDWKDPTPQEMTERVLERVGPGSITLFHCGAKNTPAALPGIISALKQKGYSFLTVGEMIYRDHYYLDHTGRQFPDEG